MANRATTQYNPLIASKRRERDVMKLLMSNYKVIQNKENSQDFLVEFPGPKNTIYEGGLWTIHVLLPDQYPYKSPSIGFTNKIWHPNIDEASGSVCLDVINQTWSPMYDLINVFDVFIPQLLSYPNPSDPLNTIAAGDYKNEKKYEEKVKDYIKKYATPPQQKEEEKKVRKESKTIIQTAISKKDSDDIIIEEEQELDNMSNISMSDVSELSQNSCIEQMNEDIIQLY